MKKVTTLLLVIVFLISLTACTQIENPLENKEETKASTLSGRYASSGNKYSVEFREDGTCTWYQPIMGAMTFFEGTYQKIDDYYELRIKGDGLFVPNTVFIARPANGGLIITGGEIKNLQFNKK